MPTLTKKLLIEPERLWSRFLQGRTMAHHPFLIRFRLMRHPEEPRHGPLRVPSSSSTRTVLPSLSPSEGSWSHSLLKLPLTLHRGPFSSAALPESQQENSSSSQDVPVRRSLISSEATARFLLLLVSVFWGTYGPAVRFVYEQPHSPFPSILTLARKALSLLFCFCFLPLETSIANSKHVAEELASQEDKTAEPTGGRCSNQLLSFLTDVVGADWLAAIELGFWTFLGTACQTDGLENTTATRAGFLLQSVTVLVPLLSTFSGVRVKSTTWFASFLALLGVTYLSLQSQLDTVLLSSNILSSNAGMSKGDVEILLAAFFYAFCTVRLSNYAANLQAIQLSTKLMVISTCLAASWVILDHEGRELWVFPSTNIILAIIFSALVPGTLASFGQTIGQKYISAAEAQVYFSLQPFFSAVFASVILKEDIDMTLWVGGLILFIATSLVSIDSLRDKQL